MGGSELPEKNPRGVTKWGGGIFSNFKGGLNTLRDYVLLLLTACELGGGCPTPTPTRKSSKNVFKATHLINMYFSGP